MPLYPRRAALAALAWVFAASAALAQTYPSKPVTIVIGYTPGAVSDLTARTIAANNRSSCSTAAATRASFCAVHAARRSSVRIAT